MGNPKALAEIARLGLPAEQREKNLQDLGLWIAPEDLREVRALLASGPSDWSRSYPPSAAIAVQAREVLVGCFDGLLKVACKPHHRTSAPATTGAEQDPTAEAADCSWGGGVSLHLPPGCRLHAPSWQPRNADALAREVAIHHLPVDPSRWPAGGPQWGRERFLRRRTPYGLLAYSTDAHGRVVRGWFSTPRDHAAYLAGGEGMLGQLTAPIEAAWLAALEPGLPSLPAHLWIGAQRGWPGYRKALSRVTSQPEGR